jgi:hypothetical protein
MVERLLCLLFGFAFMATPKQRAGWELIGGCRTIKSIDEDILLQSPAARELAMCR